MTSEALQQYHRSQATIRVIEGSDQTYCRTISSTPEASTTVRWDTLVLRCGEDDVPMDSACKKHDVNTFISGGNNYDLATLRKMEDDVEHTEDAYEAAAPWDWLERETEEVAETEDALTPEANSTTPDTPIPTVEANYTVNDTAPAPEANYTVK